MKSVSKEKLLEEARQNLLKALSPKLDPDFILVKLGVMENFLKKAKASYEDLGQNAAFLIKELKSSCYLEKARKVYLSILSVTEGSPSDILYDLDEMDVYLKKAGVSIEAIEPGAFNKVKTIAQLAFLGGAQNALRNALEEKNPALRGARISTMKANLKISDLKVEQIADLASTNQIERLVEEAKKFIKDELEAKPKLPNSSERLQKSWWVRPKPPEVN